MFLSGKYVGSMVTMSRFDMYVYSKECAGNFNSEISQLWLVQTTFLD